MRAASDYHLQREHLLSSPPALDRYAVHASPLIKADGLRARLPFWYMTTGAVKMPVPPPEVGMTLSVQKKVQGISVHLSFFKLDELILHFIS